MCMGTQVLKYLKEELAWATVIQIQVIYNAMLFKTISYTTKELKNKAFLSLKQYCMHCYV